MGDQELLDVLRRTPERGMAALMERYAGLVYAVVKRRLPGDLFCPADVEGCAADTFSEFYLDLGKYDLRKGSIRSWLCVIARHNAQDLVRRRYREAGVIPLDRELEAADDGAVLEAVRGLGEPDREIVLRKYYLGEPTREIAARLGLTASNVDTRAHRAVEKLRGKLKEWG